MSAPAAGRISCALRHVGSIPRPHKHAAGDWSRCPLLGEAFSVEVSVDRLALGVRVGANDAVALDERAIQDQVVQAPLPALGEEGPGAGGGLPAKMLMPSCGQR